MSQHEQVDHIFRHEYGFLVASLLKRMGTHHLDAVGDAVQYAMMQALDCWYRQGIPDNHSAWLYRVAYHKLISEFRLTKRRQELLNQQAHSEDDQMIEQSEIPLQGEMGDALLRMLFVACSDLIPIESQLVFTLKSLCGFSVKEVALRLFLTEANVYKRISRAKQYLSKHLSLFDKLTDSELAARLPMVHRVLYLVFTEGYLSSHTNLAIRKDLCEEAIRLTQLLSKSKLGNSPESHALLALMYFHLARLNARQDSAGTLLLLEQQDRTLWDHGYIRLGMRYLAQSAQGDKLSRYHVEAGIAAEHCVAASFEETRWEKIVVSYDVLEKIAPSALHCLNRAVALAEWKNPEAGLAALQEVNVPNWLTRSYQWYAVHADLLFRCGKNTLARKSAEKALAFSPSSHIQHLLNMRFARYES